MNTKFLKIIKSSKSYNSLYKIPLQLFKKHFKPELLQKPIKILLLTSTCNGFGDVIFSCKLKKYLKEWYGDLVQVKIATNSVKQFTSMEEPISELIHLGTTHKNIQCREFRSLKPFDASAFVDTGELIPEDINVFNLYLIAPITYDFNPDFNEIHYLVKNSNRFNTFFLCEYNYPIDKDVLFNVGVGKSRLGLFLIGKEDEKSDRLPTLNNPYSIIYIAQNDLHLSQCYRGFIELITTKYKLPQLDIVCPFWMKDIIIYERVELRRKISKHYSQIEYVYNQDEKIVTEVLDSHMSKDNKGVLTFRFDIFPVPFKKVLSLYQHSLPQVLLTGDQSITDFLSLRYNDSVPYYQGLPWKQNFYTSMSKALPQKFFKSYKTSCGNLHAIKYKPKFTNFIKKNDFRVNAKPIMDSVIMSVGYNSEEYRNIKNTILKSRKLSTLKNKLEL
jgi:hypothetical protein